MQITELKDKGRVLQSQLLLQMNDIEHYSSTKETVNAEEEVWMPRQVHGIAIATPPKMKQATKEEDLAEIPEADAVICDIPGQWIGVRTADCVPVLLYDPQRRVTAAIHAGWRGTVKHIVQKTIQRLKQAYNCEASNLYAMVGPSISPESFEVGSEVAEEFVKAGRKECIISSHLSSALSHLSPSTSEKPHIDLWQSNVMDMLEEGMDLSHIDCTPLCTLQNTDLLYSARKESISTGRIVTAIRML